MSHLLARILLSVLLFPLAMIFDTALYALTWQALRDAFDHNHVDAWVCNSLTAVLMMICWWLLWRGFVRWTPARRAWALAAILPALAGGGVIYFVLASGGPDEEGIVGGALATPVFWMLLATIGWRDRPPAPPAAPAPHGSSVG